MSGRVATVRTYYAAIDEDDYERLGGILASGFVQQRPDRSLEGRERFVRFMREERPRIDTRHPIDALYRAETGEDVVARGRLVGSDGDLLARFVDVFSFEGSAIARIRTYTA